MSLKSHIIKAAAGLGLAALPFAQAIGGRRLGRRRHAHQLLEPPTSIDDEGGSRRFVSDFALNSARLYISGKATENIGFMFNTEYNSDDEEIRVIDAAAQFSFSGDKHNIWVGRFLPPSDRANLYGPYYASHWGVYQDGVQDGYPFETEGRDDGVMYWGQFDMVKFSIGAFDVTGLTTGDSDVLLRLARAGRLLGRGRRLLPERHVLRREGPAGRRPRGANRGCRRGLHVRLPAREEARQLRRHHGRSPSTRCTTASAAIRHAGGRPRYEKQTAIYVLGAYLFRGRSRSRQVPGARQVRPGHLRLRSAPTSTRTRSSST